MLPINVLLYAGVLFGWSTSWLPLSWQLGVVAPEISLFWRFLIATPLMAALALLSGQTLKFHWKVHWRFAALGLCIFSGNFALFYHAGSGVASGLLAVVFSTASLINVIMNSIIARKWPPMLHVLATLVGIAGVAMLYWPELQMSNAAFQSLVFCFVGTMLFCTGNMVSENSQHHSIPVCSSTTWGMLYGTCYLGIFSLLVGHEFVIEVTTRYLGSLVWLSVMSTVLTFSCYLLLIGRIGTSRAGYATVLFPVFALFLSTSFENYHWNLPGMIGLGLVLIGNFIMIRAR